MSDEMGITPAQAELFVRIRLCAADLMGEDVLRGNKLRNVIKVLEGVSRDMWRKTAEGGPNPKGIRFVVKPDDRRVVENGVMKSERLFGCWDIGELVVEDGVVELEDGCLNGMPNLRRLYLPVSLKKICGLGDSLEEIEFEKGCSCTPRFWCAESLRHLVWPGKCETCAGTFDSCRNLSKIIGFDVVKRIDVDALKRLESVDVTVLDDVELMGIDVNEDIPQKFHGMLMHRRPQAVSLIGVLRDRSKSIAERVDAWLELTSSNMTIRSLPDDMRDDVLRHDLPLNYKKFPYFEMMFPPESSSENGRAVLEKLFADSYSGMRLTMDITGGRVYEKWVSYAWYAEKYAVIEGLLRDRHPVMIAWVRKIWGKPLLFLLANVRRPKIVEAMEICFPGTIQGKLSKEGCNSALWELFLETDHWGDSRRLSWNKGIENKNMSEFVETCARDAEPLIRLGADPNQKDKHGFSWNDVMDGLKRRYCKKP